MKPLRIVSRVGIAICVRDIGRPSSCSYVVLSPVDVSTQPRGRSQILKIIESCHDLTLSIHPAISTIAHPVEVSARLVSLPMTRTHIAVDNVAVRSQSPTAIRLLAPELLTVSRLVGRELSGRWLWPLSELLRHAHAGVRLGEVGLLHSEFGRRLADEVVWGLWHGG